MITTDKIEAITTEYLKDKVIYVTGIRISDNNNITVFLDGDEGVKIADCVALSRYIESELGDDENYSIDVSSHGASAPLIFPRQYKRHVGREFDIKLNDGSKISAELVNCNEEGLHLKYSVRENKPIGKGKITVEKEIQLKFEQIKESKIKLKF
ncbi:MAG: ribosome assembly cofactor RimP [Sphingobacteriaceae bacterium]|nr:ribosome assembly cofactor RimP [Sphingobacteriaceae bacterium]